MPAAEPNTSRTAGHARPARSSTFADADGMREFADQFATGVSVMTARDSQGLCYGITVNAVARAGTGK